MGFFFFVLSLPASSPLNWHSLAHFVRCLSQRAVKEKKAAVGGKARARESGKQKRPQRKKLTGERRDFPQSRRRLAPISIHQRFRSPQSTPSRLPERPICLLLPQKRCETRLSPKLEWKKKRLTTGPGSATPVVSTRTLSNLVPPLLLLRSSSLNASTRSDRREQQTQPRSRLTMSSLAMRLAETVSFFFLRGYGRGGEEEEGKRTEGKEGKKRRRRSRFSLARAKHRRIPSPTMLAFLRSLLSFQP